jgi:hypothetical protein
MSPHQWTEETKMESPFGPNVSISKIEKVYWDPIPALRQVSDIHLQAIGTVVANDDQGGNLEKVKLSLARFSGNRYARGISQKITDRNEEVFQRFFKDLPTEPLKDIVQTLVSTGELPGHKGYRHQVEAARRAGYTTVKEITQRLAEMEVQQKLFTTTPDADMRPASWEARYERLDKDLADCGLVVTERLDEAKIAAALLRSQNVSSWQIRAQGPEKYFHSSVLLHEDEGGDLVSIPNEILRSRAGLTLPSLLRSNESTLSSTTTEIATISSLN